MIFKNDILGKVPNNLNSFLNIYPIYHLFFKNNFIEIKIFMMSKNVV